MIIITPVLQKRKLMHGNVCNLPETPWLVHVGAGFPILPASLQIQCSYHYTALLPEALNIYELPFSLL